MIHVHVRSIVWKRQNGLLTFFLKEAMYEYSLEVPADAIQISTHNKNKKKVECLKLRLLTSDLSATNFKSNLFSQYHVTEF